MSGSSVNPGHGHELSDFTFGPTLALVPVSIFLLVAYTLTCLYGYRGALTAEKERKVATESRNAEVTSAALKASETLGAYGWKDQSAGKVHVPIEKAMELVVEGQAASASKAADSEGEPSAP